MSSSTGADGRRFLAETAALVGAALVCALVSNALAGRERKLQPVGRYPNALTVPGAPAVPAPSEAPAPATAPATAPVPASTGSAPADPAPTSAPASGPAAAAKGPAQAPPRAASPAAAPAPAKPAAASASARPVSEAELLARFPAAPEKVFREVSGADAAWLFGQGAPFLDARRTKVFEEGHVAGALPFPVWESDIDQRVLGLVNEGRRNDLPIVVYCSGGDCEDSHMLAERLFGAGFTNLLVYRDGFPDWQKRGGAVRTGPKP